ncbi:hypothetical protein AMS68_007744 [Peltaster fructicola]|uniref:Uncharacterized protein n=1 Tax=Peltaster fructicola TaxID=286661 RepID=A0A6H0Y5A3_9PEZI|nr:hypothetical protein AMS68_007744 [Peltaster fructicola]
MPVGYIVRLEDRLIEVESALFQALADLESYKAGQEPRLMKREAIRSIAEHYNSMSKQDKIAEWEKHDVTDAASRWEWWQARNEDIGLHPQDAAGGGMANTNNAPPPANGSSEPVLDRTRGSNDQLAGSPYILDRIEPAQRHKYF